MTLLRRCKRSSTTPDPWTSPNGATYEADGWTGFELTVVVLLACYAAFIYVERG